jgi:hypothetical protein
MWDCKKMVQTAPAGWSKAQCQWKVKQLQLAAYNVNRQLGEVKADVLLLARYVPQMMILLPVSN